MTPLRALEFRHDELLVEGNSQHLVDESKGVAYSPLASTYVQRLMDVRHVLRPILRGLDDIEDLLRRRLDGDALVNYSHEHFLP